MTDMKKVVKAAEDLVQDVMGSWDGSHDPFHAYRVRTLALSLASEECLPSDSLYIVELAALLHDIDDYKYTSRGPRQLSTAEEFLENYKIETTEKQAILTIIHNVGFKEELAGSLDQKYSLELGVVQDADRLDAMGAIDCNEVLVVNLHGAVCYIGHERIGRAFTYGGSRNTAMHDPHIHPRIKMTKEEYMQKSEKQTTVNHFHEKLLRLKELLKTEAGKKRGEGRHKFMEEYLAQFHKEWNGEL